MKNYFKFLYKHAIAFFMLLIVCFLNHAYIPNNVIESIKEMDKNQNSKGYVMDV